MQKKKILHFVSGLEVGGAETQLLRVLPLLQKETENVVCCFNDHGPIGERLEKKGVRVHYLNFKGRHDLMVFWRLKKIIREFKPDILVTYLIHCDLIGRFWGRIFGIKKIVCSQRGSLLQWEYLRFFDRMTRFLVTKYTTQTHTAKKELMEKLNTPENKFIVIPNGIDLNDFSFDLDNKKKKNELGINSENTNIICVSKLREGKGHEYLLEAFEKAYTTNQKINLLIVGDGEKKEKLLNQIKGYQSKNNIYFFGDRNDVKEILRISDIFVLPTLGEGMSNAILEAMASKLPIVTTNIKVNEELIRDDETGILVPIKNSTSIMNAIKKLIDNPTLRKKMGEESQKDILKRYDINVITLRISNFLNNL